jgi:hypothetical protein
MIEKVSDARLNTFRLTRKCLHDVTSFHARLAVKGALHNVCLWLKPQRENAPFACAAFLAWETTRRNSHQMLKK